MSDKKEKTFKYHMILTVKNDNYLSPDKWIPEMDEMDKNEYYIAFKCLGDNYNECIDKLYEKCKNVIRKYSISEQDLDESVVFTKIDIDRCYRWQEMYLERSN